MKLIAIAILTLCNLAGINLSAKTTQNLESRVVVPQTNHQLAYLAPHDAVVQPVKTGTEALTLGASAVYAIDITSNAALYQKNAGQQLPIASITKLATALVILGRHDLSEKVTVPTLPAYGAADDILGLVPGDQFTIGDLVKAALVASANDAADSLALIDSGTLSAFSAKMNRLVATWGLEHTRFSNPTGLSDENNYSSAADLAKLAKLRLTNPTISQFARLNGDTITTSAGKSYLLKPTNKLLNDARFHGLKTGYTDAAGQSFVGLATIAGHEIITVVLHSPDRFGETQQLANWIERNYTWQ